MAKLTGLSYILLLITYTTFGRYLQASETPRLGWIITVLFAITLAGVMTTFWKPARNLALLGFRSNVGSLVMVLLAASLAVLVLSWVHFFTYILVIIAASLLVRIDALTLDLSNIPTFLILVGLAITGLGLSWIPPLITQGIR